MQIRFRDYRASFILILCLLAVLIACERQQPEELSVRSESEAANDSRQNLSGSKSGDWPRVGRTYDDQRYSALDLINNGNANQLGLAWFHDLETERSQEATPVVVDGVLYVSTAWSIVKAFDAGTGRLIWTYDPKVHPSVGPKACCDVANRGVAVDSGKVYVGALDGRLIALDSGTGNEIWVTQTTDPELPYTITQAPLVANGRVFVGTAGAEYKVRGYISAYDAITGELAWRFYTIPGEPGDPKTTPELEAARETWNGEFWKMGGGGTVWDSIHFDPQTNMIYFGTGNGIAWASEIRSPGGGDNLFTASVIALDADTGAYRWHHQIVPRDEWDYDVASPLLSADLLIDGRKRHVLMQANKTAYFWVWDAATGELISADPFAPLNWSTGIDMKTGRPQINPAVRYGVGKPAIIWPGPRGAHNWHPISFSPRTGLVYLSVTESNGAFQQLPPDEFELKNDAWITGVIMSSKEIDELYATPGAPARGLGPSYLQAWDPIGRREVWRAAYPEYGASGTLATAGDVVFAGDHAGNFSAYDAATGKNLWTFHTQSRVLAAASTYSVSGEQYVALMVGGRGPSPDQVRTSPTSANNSRLLVFKLGGTLELPAEPFGDATVLKLDPPLPGGTPEQVNQGRASFDRQCSGCHGTSAVADKAAPDLRYSPLLKSLSAWKDVVLGGSRARNGMASFREQLAVGEDEDIYHYVVVEANRAKDALRKSDRGK